MGARVSGTFGEVGLNGGSVGAFFAMGGKGLYVWGSYGVTFAVIALEIGLLALRRRSAGREQT